MSFRHIAVCPSSWPAQEVCCMPSLSPVQLSSKSLNNSSSASSISCGLRLSRPAIFSCSRRWHSAHNASRLFWSSSSDQFTSSPANGDRLWCTCSAGLTLPFERQCSHSGCSVRYASLAFLQAVVLYPFCRSSRLSV